MTVKISDMTATFNNAAYIYNAIGINVTDTASDPTSKLLNLKVANVSMFTVAKNGDVTTVANVVANNIIANTITLNAISTTNVISNNTITSSNVISNNTITAANIISNGTLTTNLLFANISASPPALYTSTGTTGQVVITSGYIYVCVATNSWRRAAISTW